MSSPRHTIVLDWDGTLVPAVWPEQPRELLPGALQAMRRFHAAGYKQLVFSARLNPYDPWTSQPFNPDVVEKEARYIRDVLDTHGLTYVDIWRLPGKPSGSIYIDDKGERYHGRPGSWNKLTEKVLVRLGAEEPIFPEFDQEVAAA